MVAATVPFVLGGIWLGNVQSDVHSHDKRITIVEQAPFAIGRLEENQGHLATEIARVHAELATSRALQTRTLEEVIAAREKLTAQQEKLERLSK